MRIFPVHHETDDAMSSPLALKPGLDNLLIGCIGVKAGESLTIVGEGGLHDYYSPTLVGTISAYARSLDLKVDVVTSPLLENVDAVPGAIRAAMERSDHLLFVSRVGDQLRFGKQNGTGTRTMCYALNEQSFATSFCSADYQFFVELKKLVDATIWGGKKITITCPSGTNLVGRSPAGAAERQDDVTLNRFPMTVFRPVPADTFSGTLAISKWLCATGSNFYQPDSTIVDDVVIAHVTSGRIQRFEGSAKDVATVERHYDMVAAKFAIDRNAVHSWHAGFHPHNGYDRPAIQNLTRWGGAVFGNPRYLHVHTCGSYAPGEICVSVFDPTISVDGRELWSRGAFSFAQAPETQSLMDCYPGMRRLFENPVRDIGLPED